jgi:hypothetical protein
VNDDDYDDDYDDADDDADDDDNGDSVSATRTTFSQDEGYMSDSFFADVSEAQPSVVDLTADSGDDAALAGSVDRGKKRGRVVCHDDDDSDPDGEDRCCFDRSLRRLPGCGKRKAGLNARLCACRLAAEACVRPPPAASYEVDNDPMFDLALIDALEESALHSRAMCDCDPHSAAAGQCSLLRCINKSA